MNLLPGVKASASISPCGTYRYALHRVREEGGLGSVLWIMLNPSTADAETDDPTLRRIQGYSFDRWDAASLTVVNLFAFRTSKPTELVMARARGVNTVGPDNDDHLLVEATDRATIIAAWGAHPVADLRGSKVRTILERVHHSDVHHLGLTANGSPKHPLARGKHRIPDDQEPIRWA